MIIVISAQDNTPESRVDPRFGRAAYFLAYNTEDGRYTAVANEQNVMAAQGAGIQAAQAVVALHPDLVVSGNVGPKAFRALSAAKVKVALWSEGTVAEAIELVKANKLQAADGANVEGHWM
ncbi:MAG: dinitrogenase iron-molybdenum cofactor biosynthesis protein [candidate division Zixibacteria bacterium]|nr:dinitrogenase iron-molybdenum cofactor biosynthesis protein [candidate division Zixibacteria bacterium]